MIYIYIYIYVYAYLGPHELLCTDCSHAQLLKFEESCLIMFCSDYYVFCSLFVVYNLDIILLEHCIWEENDSVIFIPLQNYKYFTLLYLFVKLEVVLVFSNTCCMRILESGKLMCLGYCV